MEGILQRQAAFFCTQLKLAAGYELTGVPLVSYGATSFLSPVWTLFQASAAHGPTQAMLFHNPKPLLGFRV